MAEANTAVSEQNVPFAGAGTAETVQLMVTVNGVDRIFDAEPRTTLAEALRGTLGLTGTKIACDRGSCCACTVLRDGLPVCSCMMLAIEANGHSITTIEGLAAPTALHPVQTAFIEHDALQCGFCTPGLVMSCAALLEHNANPDQEAILDAISGHFCRCGTYPHVMTATLAAAAKMRGDDNG
ncbi:(2Fe-2S)-binding protein [Acidocella aquatica]|uniref:(2Fe-2S)-binding protein n=1 Tax=Acidocella aquatica TaxID=1922313 RepID=A0ABQ6ACE6_9PROT|nr:(2Fe-2S)-binding protein [Acidocella aquatica]GLR68998.1 (2Fe-2S)-binding protein [Acidocella aquatica]